LRRIISSPKGISDYQERNIAFGGAHQDLVAGGLDHFAVGNDDGPSIE